MFGICSKVFPCCSQWQHYMDVGPGVKIFFGPHKVMTYVGRSGGISARKFMNLGSLKWHFLHFESTFEQNLKMTNHFFL